jgi:hypothetical protein
MVTSPKCNSFLEVLERYLSQIAELFKEFVSRFFVGIVSSMIVYLARRIAPSLLSLWYSPLEQGGRTNTFAYWCHGCFSG